MIKANACWNQFMLVLGHVLKALAVALINATTPKLRKVVRDHKGKFSELAVVRVNERVFIT